MVWNESQALADEARGVKLFDHVLYPLLEQAGLRAQRRAELDPAEFGITDQLVMVFPCPPDACLGDNVCQDGRTGPVCGVCKGATPLLIP